eukprot:TRINITY_DN5074_c0_g1_i1.p1 TRINITY_DN5074_c0_g1~~TRINITY_DN5074_c0_g1_i1.p1  ORF type:complete len:298 (-),score=92.48 TRINITY_DN5074_c0_g1_i1:457-1350(-)
MGEIKDKILDIKKDLEKLSSEPENIPDAAPDLIESLDKLSVDLDMLKKTKIAFTLDKVRKASSDEDVKKSAKALLKKWAALEAKDKKSSTSSKKDDKRELGFKITAGPPTRNKRNQLVFDDAPDFKPNLSPKEVLQMGSFGGTYFRPIYSSVTKQKYGSEVWKELPPDWLEGLNVKTQVASSIYDESKNKYKVKCGASLEEWENSGWMRAQDPYGWFQWYCRFYQGRRTSDDERQIGRWSKCCGPKGRWKNNLISKVAKAGCAYDNFGVSPVVRQTLQHWGYILTKEDFEKEKKRFQ